MNEDSIDMVEREEYLRKASSGYVILEVVSVLQKRRWLVIPIWLAISVLVVVYSIGSILLPPDKSYYPNVYTPQSLMLIQDKSDGGITNSLATSAMASMVNLSTLGITGLQSYGELANFLVTTNSFLDELVEKHGLIEKYKVTRYIKTASRNILKNKMAAIYDKKTGIFSLSITDSDPVFARDLVNSAVAVLDAKFALIDNRRTKLKMSQLESKLTDVLKEMTIVEDSLRVFQKKHGIFTIESMAEEQIATLAKVRTELLLKEIEIKTYSDLSKIEDPKIRQLRAERDNLAKLLKELEEGFSQYESSIPSQVDMTDLALEYGHLKRDLVVKEKMFELLTQQYEITKLAHDTEDPIFQIIEYAEAPDMKSGPSRTKLCIVISIIGFMVACFTAISIEFFSKRQGHKEHSTDHVTS
jgi:tyrosine-protein kinase Etk/Wzc